MSKEKQVSESFKEGSRGDSKIKERIKEAWKKAEEFFGVDEEEELPPSKLDKEKGRRISESFLKKRFLGGGGD